MRRRAAGRRWLGALAVAALASLAAATPSSSNADDSRATMRSAPAASSTDGAVAGLLIPARRRLVMKYRRIALA